MGCQPPNSVVKRILNGTDDKGVDNDRHINGRSIVPRKARFLSTSQKPSPEVVPGHNTGYSYAHAHIAQSKNARERWVHGTDHSGWLFSTNTATFVRLLYDMLYSRRWFTQFNDILCLDSDKRWTGLANPLITQQTRDIQPILCQCWSTVYDAGPTLTQN